MVVDKQKIITRSESRRYRVAGRLEVRAGSMVRQTGSESRQARVKTGRTSKRERRKSRSMEKNLLVDLTRRTGNRQTENTGINTQGLMRKTGDTWRFLFFIRFISPGRPLENKFLFTTATWPR